jgi:hypothetical protein
MADNTAVDNGSLPDYTVATLDLGGSIHAQVFSPLRASTAVVTQVGDSATSVTLKALNAARKGLVIVNDSSAVLYVKYGATASASSYSYRLAQYDTLEMGAAVYTGVVDGIWSSDAGGNALVTEL